MPIGHTLVRIGDAQEQRLRERAAHELKGDGKAVQRESRRYAHRRNPEEVGGPIVARYRLDARDVVGPARGRLGDRRNWLRVHRSVQNIDATATELFASVRRESLRRSFGQFYPITAAWTGARVRF